MSAVLKSRKFQCLSASGIQEGLDILKTGVQVDTILMDMMMPEMDGYEAIALLKQYPDYSPIPIVAVTAQAMAGDREKCLEAGADAYISKPVDIDKLVGILHEIN